MLRKYLDNAAIDNQSLCKFGTYRNSRLTQQCQQNRLYNQSVKVFVRRQEANAVLTSPLHPPVQQTVNTIVHDPTVVYYLQVPLLWSR
jgi:hypothetical protein